MSPRRLKFWLIFETRDIFKEAKLMFWGRLALRMLQAAK
jgi:hypothetical protein